MELPPGFRGYGVKNYIENPESAKRQAEVDAIRQKMEAEGKDRWAIQDAIMPYQHLLPKRLLGRKMCIRDRGRSGRYAGIARQRDQRLGRQ